MASIPIRAHLKPRNRCGCGFLLLASGALILIGDKPLLKVTREAVFACGTPRAGIEGERVTHAMDRWAQSDQRVSTVHQRKRGLSVARDIGSTAPRVSSCSSPTRMAPSITRAPRCPIVPSSGWGCRARRAELRRPKGL